MSNINIRRRISRQPYLFVAGLASVGLVCLQLTSDVDDYDMNRQRRQMESTNSLAALHIPSDVDIDNSNNNDLRRQLRQLEKSTNKDTLKDSTTLRILQSNDYDNITDARLLADNTTITLEEVDEACNFVGILGPTEIPEDIEFAKTLIVGYPGADKRTPYETSLDCIYDSLIANNPTGQSPGEAEGYIDYRNRTGVLDRKHHVSTRHLTKMVKQLTRLITKYSSMM